MLNRKEVLNTSGTNAPATPVMRIPNHLISRSCGAQLVFAMEACRYPRLSRDRPALHTACPRTSGGFLGSRVARQQRGCCWGGSKWTTIEGCSWR